MALALPVGLERDAAGKVHKSANREVQERLELVFSSFLRLKSASQVLRLLNEQSLFLPRRDRFGDVIWRAATIAAVLAILKNPAYGGRFVYGRTRTTHPSGPGGPAVQTRLPPEQWRIQVPDVYPAYVSWDRFGHVQQILADNYAAYDAHKTRGIPRPGAALLQGIVCCGACGHKLLIQYRGGTRYLCNHLRQQYRVPVCQNLPADPIDAAVVAAFFAALAPVELDAYAAALERQSQVQNALSRAQQHQLERLRYAAALAERQFGRVDPDNRLVAGALEKRWEEALYALHQAEAAAATITPASALDKLSPELQAAFRAIGMHLPALWQAGCISTPQQKALLRCLIEKVVVQRSRPDTLATRIVWQGGETTTLEILTRVGRLRDRAGADEMEQLIVERSRAGIRDEAIATELTELGYRSPLAASMLVSTVKTIRLRHGILITQHQAHPRQVSGYLTVSQLARRLQVGVHWIYDRLHNGTIALGKDAVTRLYLFPDNTATLEALAALKNGLVSMVSIGALGNQSASEAARCAR